MLMAAMAAVASRRRRVAPSQAAGSLSVDLTITSSAGGTNVPFTFGQTFKQGEVPAGSSIGGSDQALQLAVKNAWPDGSAKFGIVSGRRTVSAATPAAVGIVSGGTAASGADLTTTDLKATGITASIDYGAYGTVSWATTDWDSPFLAWIAGPTMSSWVYRKAIGADAHLVGWLEVRLYLGGAVEVRAWIENGYLTVSSPGSRTGTATFTLGGSSRFSQTLTLLNHQRATLASGWPVTHWLSSDPGVTPKHDVAYMQDTKLVPKYRGNSVSSSAVAGRMNTTYTALAAAGTVEPMRQSGYQTHIGILPEWDVAYLTTAASLNSFKSVIVNAESAGRYGTHYRNQATNLPLRFSSFPNHGLGTAGDGAGIPNCGGAGTNLPTPSGTVPPEFDGAHHPSYAYMAYLLTGWYYYLEEVQFTATCNYLRQSTSGRQGASGVFISNAGSDITRGAAWSMRTLAQAACITPDSDTTLRTEFANSIDANINWYHARYVAQSNNPLGLVQPYDTTYTGAGWQGAVWMDDFFTASWGYMKDLQVNGSSTQSNLDAFLAWKYVSIVGRMGGTSTSERSYRYLDEYTVSYAPGTDGAANYTNGTGPWYAHWGESADADGLPHDGSAGASLTGTYVTNGQGRLSNAQAAIAYAVDHGATGAATGYARMTAASNWATHAAVYNDEPVQGVKPRTV